MAVPRWIGIKVIVTGHDWKPATALPAAVKSQLPSIGRALGAVVILILAVNIG